MLPTFDAVVLPPALLERMEAHAREEAPRECCGLLLGHPNAIVGIVAAINVATEDTRYLVDPRDHFDALRQARRSGLDVIGAYHSHPRSRPEPSPTDTAEAIEHFLYVIVSPRSSGGTDVRAFRLVDRNFREVPLVSEP